MINEMLNTETFGLYKIAIVFFYGCFMALVIIAIKSTNRKD